MGAVLVLLYGPDELLRRRRLEQLREQADGGSGMLISNLSVVEGRTATVDEILGPAMSAPFLGPHRLVVVEGFLDRFEPAGEQREGRSIEAFAPVIAAAGGLPPSTILVFTGLKVGARNPMLAALKKVPGVEVLECAKLEKEALLRFIREEGVARGVRFHPARSNRALGPGEEWRRPKETDPAVLLAALFQSDTLAIVNELDKLALFSMGREVTVDTVDTVCGGERESTIWNLLDATMDGDLSMAFNVTEYLVQHGESVQGILAMLTLGYRRLGTVIGMLEDGAAPEEIGKAINQQWPGLRDRTIARARRLGAPGLRAAYEAIVAGDRSIKSGEAREDLALEILLCRLATLAPASAARRSA